MASSAFFASFSIKFGTLSLVHDPPNKSNGQIKLEKNHEELKDNGRIQICYGISHEKSGGYSDLTIEHLNNRIESIHGIKGEFRMLLRLATEMVKSNGPMIIFSAYDAYYVDKGKAYGEIWDKVK